MSAIRGGVAFSAKLFRSSGAPDGGARGHVCLPSPTSRGEAACVMWAVTVLRASFRVNPGAMPPPGLLLA